MVFASGLSSSSIFFISLICDEKCFSTREDCSRNDCLFLLLLVEEGGTTASSYPAYFSSTKSRIPAQDERFLPCFCSKSRLRMYIFSESLRKTATRMYHLFSDPSWTPRATADRGLKEHNDTIHHSAEYRPKKSDMKSI